ncbi:hypothetical protein B296_00034565 [Ensete ventricosum]|uniref:Uncharacterized protein n=1 Tax=Ensete ventricosum TaxID=4639 RepID=A0A427A866_ENSVE|nr:hypothetical protein B296_00034565 [Ensete ventricosum]
MACLLERGSNGEDARGRGLWPLWSGVMCGARPFWFLRWPMLPVVVWYLRTSMYPSSHTPRHQPQVLRWW